MKKGLLLLICLGFSLLSYTQIPGWSWAKSALATEYDQVSSVATDQGGNVIVTGYFSSDSIVIGNTTLYNNTPGFSDIFIAKLDSSGDYLWAISYGGSLDDKGFKVATDANGNIFLGANFYSPQINVDTYTFINAGNVGDILLVKYDPSGNVLWATREGGPGVEIPHTLTVDNSGNLYVAGRFSSLSIAFGTFTLTQSGSMDVFIVKYDASGNVLWAVKGGGTSNDEAHDILIRDGYVYVTGYFNGNATFGSQVLSTNGSSDLFLAKLNVSNGNYLWAKKYGGDGIDESRAIADDIDGNIYLTGTFRSTDIIFGSVTLNNFYAAGNSNAFITRLDSSGIPVWAHAINGKSNGRGIDVSGNHVYTSGAFNEDSLNYGSYTLIENGSSDFYLTHCDRNGNNKWTTYQSSGGGSSEFSTTLATDPFGNVIIGGYHDSDPVVFGPSTLISDGDFDLLIARMGSLGVGMEETEPEASFRVYPNPFKGKTTLDCSRMQGKINVRIFNMTGSITKTFSIQAPVKYTVSLQDYPGGIYFVELSGEKEKTRSKIVLY